MKNTAIIASIIATGIMGMLIFKPFTPAPAPEPVSETSILAVEAPAVEQVTTLPDPAPLKNPAAAPAPANTPAQTPSAPVNTTPSYTEAEVATHASVQSCWTIVNGSVYDLTSWIARHPGGSSAIKRMCGVDASEDFNDQHGRSLRPEHELAGFFIGKRI